MILKAYYKSNSGATWLDTLRLEMDLLLVPPADRYLVVLNAVHNLKERFHHMRGFRIDEFDPQTGRTYLIYRKKPNREYKPSPAQKDGLKSALK